MAFIEQLESRLEERYNVSITENAGLGYKTSGKKLVDMTFIEAVFDLILDTAVSSAMKKEESSTTGIAGGLRKPP